MSKQQNLDEIMKISTIFGLMDKKDAEIVIKRALRIYPKMHQLWSYRGIACASLENLKKQKNHFSKQLN